MTTSKTAHIYFLLDVSGSMSSIATDVIGGFNQFRIEQIRESVATGVRVLMTLVQFDSGNPHHVVTDALDLGAVPNLSRENYRPNGLTPLYDAIGALITDATIRSEQRDHSEEIMFVVFTDGKENHSREYTKESVFRLIKKHQEQGWTFVFLGANQDSYGEGGGIGIDPRSIQNFEPSPDGARAAFSSLGKGFGKEIGKIARHERRDTGDFFEGDKEAEALLRKDR